MTAPARPPIVTEERALHVAAFVALIDASLFDSDGVRTRHAAQRLLARLTATGIAEATSSATGLRMAMFGIAATSDGSVCGLLRAWQEAAKLRIEAGVQR